MSLQIYEKQRKDTVDYPRNRKLTFPVVGFVQLYVVYICLLLLFTFFFFFLYIKIIFRYEKVKYRKEEDIREHIARQIQRP